MITSVLLVLFSLIYADRLSNFEDRNLIQSTNASKSHSIYAQTSLAFNTSLVTTQKHILESLSMKPAHIEPPRNIMKPRPSISLENVSPHLFMKLVAGQSSSGYGADENAATSVAIRAGGQWVDSNGIVYVTTLDYYRIRKIDTSGIIHLFGGTTSQSSSGTGGPINSVSFFSPYFIIGDASGNNLYMSDQYYVWKYSFNTGIISVYAGAPGQARGWNNDNVQATTAQLYYPEGIWITTSDELYISDCLNHRVRKVASSGIITTIVGNGTASWSGDGHPAASATINRPYSVYLDTNGRLFIADQGNHRIRRVDNSIIATFAGTGTGSYNSDEIAATSAYLHSPTDVKGDSLGNIYLSEEGNPRIRMVDTNGIIFTVFGNGTPGFASGVSSRSSGISNSYGLWIDALGTVYFSDYNSVHRGIVLAPTSQPSTRPSAYPSRHPSSQPSSTPSSQPSGNPTGQPTLRPNGQPSRRPTDQPTSRPTGQPSSLPSMQPRTNPTSQPTRLPTRQPSSRPTGQPTTTPSVQPTTEPSMQPSSQPSEQPVAIPSSQPSARPTNQPSRQPSVRPSTQPSSRPSTQPSDQPSRQPSTLPTSQPTRLPTGQPSVHPTSQPSAVPSRQPTNRPSSQPTNQPSVQPTSQPSFVPSSQPTNQPSRQPSVRPSTQPSSRPSTQPSDQPSRQPSTLPTSQPSAVPSRQPTNRPSSHPTNQPSGQPFAVPSTQPSSQPTAQPSRKPAAQPSGIPTSQPSGQPSVQPSSEPSDQPTLQPTTQPTSTPTRQPSGQPTSRPSTQPSFQPSSCPTRQPTAVPSRQPTRSPTSQPSRRPTAQPTRQPSGSPSSPPTTRPSDQPSVQPTVRPTMQPFSRPSCQPSSYPSSGPTGQPTNHPSVQPSAQPSSRPTFFPSNQPTVCPSSQPTDRPSSQPSSTPSSRPSNQPSCLPTSTPSKQPNARPTVQPTYSPSRQPSSQPSSIPSAQPTRRPSNQPSSTPSCQPSSFPTCQPTAVPSSQPSSTPSNQPTSLPSSQPTTVPSSIPSFQPSNQPSDRPSSLPTVQPSGIPSVQPSVIPSSLPTMQPTQSPTDQPTVFPSTVPSKLPSAIPTSQPSDWPTSQPTMQPSCSPFSQPTNRPTDKPSCQPTLFPSSQPSSCPSNQPSITPSSQPTTVPSKQPIGVPSSRPSLHPSTVPTVDPTRQPSRQPTSQPSRQPITRPSAQPSASPSSARPTGAPTLATKAPQMPSITFYPSSTCKPTRSPTTRMPTLTPTVCLSVLPHTQQAFQGSLFLHLDSFPGTFQDEPIIENIDMTNFMAEQESFVVFGQKDATKLSRNINVRTTDSLLTTGLKLTQPVLSKVTNKDLVRSVAVVGDINKDTNPDLLVGYPYVSLAIVYYGKEPEQRFTGLTASFTIYGEPFTLFGWAVSGTGDINGDIVDDFMISSSADGMIYVIFGKENTNHRRTNLFTKSLSAEDGFKITGSSGMTYTGVAVANCGDFNNDGVRDILFSAVNPKNSQGIIYILFGKANNASTLFQNISLDQLNATSTNILTITAPLNRLTGRALAGIGDINNDGFDDIAIGSVPFTGSNDQTYVIFGRPFLSSQQRESTLDINSMREGIDGFTLFGAGFMVAAPGDLNGDKIPDLMIIHFPPGKSGSFFLQYPETVTSSPTVSPTSFPTSQPSSLPSVSPSMNPSCRPTGQSTARNETSRPVQSRSPTTIYPTLPPQVTLTPTINPTRLPTRNPTVNSTFSPPTRLPSASSVPTVRPSLLLLSSTPKPTSKATAQKSPLPTVDFRRLRGSWSPSRLPTVMPTINSTNYIDVDCSKAGKTYEGKNETHYKFTITLRSRGTIQVVGNEDGGAKNLFVLQFCPEEPVNVVIKNFRLATDIISVAHLGGDGGGYAYPSFNEIPFSLKSGQPLTLLFCAENKLQVVLLSHYEFDLSERNFLFSPADSKWDGSNRNDKNGNSDELSLVQIGVVSGVILLLLSICVVLSYQKKLQEKEDEKLEELFLLKLCRHSEIVIEKELEMDSEEERNLSVEEWKHDDYSNNNEKTDQPWSSRIWSTEELRLLKLCKDSELVTEEELKMDSEDLSFEEWELENKNDEKTHQTWSPPIWSPEELRLLKLSEMMIDEELVMDSEEGSDLPFEEWELEDISNNDETTHQQWSSPI
jgi:hypothetical protein